MVLNEDVLVYHTEYGGSIVLYCNLVAFSFIIYETLTHNEPGLKLTKF